MPATVDGNPDIARYGLVHVEWPLAFLAVLVVTFLDVPYHHCPVKLDDVVVVVSKIRLDGGTVGIRTVPFVDSVASRHRVPPPADAVTLVRTIARLVANRPILFLVECVPKCVLVDEFRTHRRSSMQMVGCSPTTTMTGPNHPNRPLAVLANVVPKLHHCHY